MPSDQLQSLVAHNARSYSCYRRFVLLRRKWKWSPVSHQLLVSVQNRKIKMKLSCFVSQMLSSGVESWCSGSAQLLVASWKFSSPSPVPVIVKVVTEERFATRRSRPNDHQEADLFSTSTLQQKIENPIPSCRYRRSNGGWCLPTSSGRGAPGTSPGAPSGCGSRTWIMDINCCNDSIVIVFQVQGGWRGVAL